VSSDSIEEAVRAALAGVVHPDTGRDILSAGHVQGLVTDEEGGVRFSFQLGPDDPGGLVKEARRAAESVDGVASVKVNVQLPQTSPGGARPQPGPRPTGPGQPGPGPSGAGSGGGLQPGSVPAPTPKPGLLSGTFTGETVSFEVGRRIVERLRDGDYYGDDGRIARHHKIFRDHVDALAARHPDWFGDVPEELGAPGIPDIKGGLGGMMRFTPFKGDKERIVKACHACFDEGVVLFYCGHDPYHVRFLPPLGVMEESAWDDVFEIVERAMSTVDAE